MQLDAQEKKHDLNSDWIPHKPGEIYRKTPQGEYKRISPLNIFTWTSLHPLW